MSLIQAASGVSPKHIMYGCGLALVLFVCWFFYQTGYKACQNDILKDELKAANQAVDKHNEDVAENTEAAVIIQEKKVYVDKIVYKTQIKTIQAECPDGAHELISVFINPLVQEANSTITSD